MYKIVKEIRTYLFIAVRHLSESYGTIHSIHNTVQQRASKGLIYHKAPNFKRWVVVTQGRAFSVGRKLNYGLGLLQIEKPKGKRNCLKPSKLAGLLSTRSIIIFKFVGVLMKLIQNEKAKCAVNVLNNIFRTSASCLTHLVTMNYDNSRPAKLSARHKPC